MDLRKFIFKAKLKFVSNGAFLRLDELRRNEHLSPEMILAQQEHLKKHLIANVVKNNVFYERHYGAVGFELGDMEQDGWFEKLPIVTKKHLREHFDEFTPSELKQYRKISTTGGSTGTPTKTGYDSRVFEAVYSWRLQSWYGINPWDDHAYVWRIPNASQLSRLKNALMWWPTKHLKLDATFIAETDIQVFLRDFNRVKPALLQGYVGAVTQLAQYVVDHRLTVHSPKCVWVTSAPLSPVQRALLERAFGSHVCDQYGSCEVRWIAQQGPECKGLHVNTEHVCIEFVDENSHAVSAGHYGKVLLTNLEDRVFPLIRYENGDRGRWLMEPCSCGRTLPCIDAIKGRESESFVLPSGMVVNGEYLTTLFDGDPSLVKGFRVVQQKDSSIRVEYVSSGASDADVRLSKIKDKLCESLRHEVLVVFQAVSKIPHDRGKLRFVIKE